MKTYISSQDIRKDCLQKKSEGMVVAMVPTMGALHQGHLSLVELAKSKADFVVVSIFVNPKQFGPNEDFSTYPRTIKEDLKKLSESGADAVFLPNASEMYPDGYQTFVNNNVMSKVLCGSYRPGHFEGVLTVVAKLLNMVQPDFAVFGKKDYQQLKVIEAMVRDLNMPMTVLGGDIVRENDGLAMSSRNVRLTENERSVAPEIYQALTKVNDAYGSGVRSIADLREIFETSLQSDLLKLQYAEIRDQTHLEEFSGEIVKPAVMAVAVFLGSVRLIDNIELGR